jgi:hypothetical protein
VSQGFASRSIPSGGPGTDASEICPVCLQPDEGAVTCAECGWQLLGDYVLGPVTRTAEAEFATRLAAHRLGYDLRAAVRVAGPAGERDEDDLARLARLVRGNGESTAETIKAAEDQVDASDVPLATTSAGIGFALTRLVAEQTDAIAFVEMGPDAVAAQILVSGDLGVPEPLDDESLPWTELLPSLPPDDDLRRLLMAGYVGVRDDADTPAPAALRAAVHEAVEATLNRLLDAAANLVARRPANGRGETAARRVDTVLVRRTYCWPVLDAVIAEAREILRPVAEIVTRARGEDLADVVERVSAQAPLRYACDLVLAAVDGRTRAVSVEPQELFPAGAAALPADAAAVLPAGPKPATLRVAAVQRHAPSRVALPVVARRSGDADYRDLRTLEHRRPLVAMSVLDGAFPGPVELTMTLVRPMDLKINADPPKIRPVEAVANWPVLLGRLPAGLPADDEPGAGSLDLVLLIELGGDEATVARRVKLAQEVIDTVRPGMRMPLRVAVLGYRDHSPKHRSDAINVPDLAQEALVVGCGLSRPGSARKLLEDIEQWRGVEIHHYHAAPIEDALEMLADPAWKWEESAKHVLLTIGSRPPHPPKQGTDRMLPCKGCSPWQESLAWLRDGLGVECFAVLDRPVTPGYAEDAWRLLASRRRYAAQSVTAGRLAADLTASARASAAEVRLATLANSASSWGAGVERSR